MSPAIQTDLPQGLSPQTIERLLDMEEKEPGVLDKLLRLAELMAKGVVPPSVHRMLSQRLAA